MEHIPILLINLSNRCNRLLHTLSELRKVNMSDYTTRIEACNEQYAKDNMHQYITNRVFNNIINTQSTMILPNFKALGCALSHIKCWKYILNSNLNGCFIVEDDIKIINVNKFLFDLDQVKRLIKKGLKKSKDLFISLNAKQINFNSQISYNYIPYYLNETYNSYYGYEDNIYFQNHIINQVNNNLNYSSTENNLELIKNPIIGTHFYYISKGMAKYFINNLEKITYQIDIEIGLLSNKVFNANCNKKIFINLKTSSIQQDKNFPTDIQSYNVDVKEISDILNLTEDISKIIYEFIPNCFKKCRNHVYNTVNTTVNNCYIESLLNYPNY